MRLISASLCILLAFAFIAPPADARGDRRGGGGGGGGGGASKSFSPKRSGGSVKRSPMTGSKMQRPASRPMPKSVARPAGKPGSRPEARPMSRPEGRPMSRPEGKPSQRPAARPTTRPTERPSIKKPSIQRPENRPGNLPDRKPDLTRPSNLPDRKPGFSRPDQRPSWERPGINRPSTLPGMVSYPNRPDKGKPNRPNFGGNDRDKIDFGDRNNKFNTGDRNRVNFDNSRDRNKVHIDNVNIGRRNVGLNRPSTLPANRRNWDNNKWGGNKSVWGNRVNIGNSVNINNNFRYNNNFSYRPNCWGARPWWGAGNCHGWHHGHWNYGWNNHYHHSHWWHDDDDDFGSGFMWGIGVWSLGNLIYDMGYQSYRNPYPAPPVQAQYGGSKAVITYTEPVSVTAAAMPPGDDQTATIAETKSDEALERSRTAFQQGDYLAASKGVDEALGYTPGDVTLHEYRALIFFALGKYSDAAGVLNPVLASGPGWGWDTMIGFYNDSETYNEHLRKLESYAKGSPDKADAQFLLGYHYLVCGHIEKSYEQFAKAAELQPADSISRQLRDLTASSIPDDGDSEAEPPARPAPIPADQLVGTWVSDRGADGKVTFAMNQDGNYTWSFMNGGKASELKGTYGLNDKGLLVLTSDDSQMVSAVEMTEGSKMLFTLIGAPDGDPGLEFVRN